MNLIAGWTKEVSSESPAPAPAPAAPTQAKMADTTSLLHNEDESFALAPVEASALKGQRRQRKRKLIVDEIKAITREGMKAQVSDSSDIVTSLDIAPPTKRLMHWKETGGVDELFSLPGLKLFSRNILVDYQNNLKQQPFGTPVHDASYAGGPPQQQTSFTEQWVNQVQSNPTSREKRMF